MFYSVYGNFMHVPTTCCKKCQVAKRSLWLLFYKKDNSSIDIRGGGPSRQLLLLKFMYWPSFLLTLSYLLCMQKATVTWYAAHLAASFSRCYS